MYPFARARRGAFSFSMVVAELVLQSDDAPKAIEAVTR